MENSPKQPELYLNTYKFKFNSEHRSIKAGINVFMLGYGQAAIHLLLKDDDIIKQYLVYCNLHGDKVYHRLKTRSTVKQLRHYEFIVLSLANFSVDKVDIINKQWKVQNIKGPQILAYQHAYAKLFLFQETDSFCITESSSGQKIIYYKQKQGHFQKIYQKIMVQPKQLFKIDERGAVGWMEHQKMAVKQNRQWRSGQYVQETVQKEILHYINFDSLDFKFYEQEIKGFAQYLAQFPCKGLKIKQIVEVVPNVYLCISNQTENRQYWLYDTRNSDKTIFQKINQNEQHNLQLFGYDNYRFKGFGQFAVLTEEQFAQQQGYGKDYIPLNPEKTVRICQQGTRIKHLPKVCVYSYLWDCFRQNNQFIFTVTSQANAKDIYMYMLLHINEDFDDDLLQDILETIIG